MNGGKSKALIRPSFWGGMINDAMADRLAIPSLEDGAHRTRQRILAWSLIALSYGLGWGVSTYYAFVMLLNSGVLEQNPYTADVFFNNLTDDIFTLIPAVFGIIYFMPKGLSRRVSLRTSLRTIPTYHIVPFLVMLSAGGVAQLVGLDSYDYPSREHSTTLAYLLDAVDSAMAGPTEELAVLALPVIALRRVGYSWPVVFVTAALLRVPFHMYYGWATVIFALWAIFAVLLYRRTCAIAAIIVSHALHNFIIRIGGVIDDFEILNILICALALPVCLFYIERRAERDAGNGRRRGGAAAQNPSAGAP